MLCIMQAIILAAGRGKRMGEITKTIPKPLLKINGKTLIEYKIEALPEKITEVIIVVGHLQDEIRNTIGEKVGEREIRYVEQLELTGTATALWSAKNLIHDKFIVLMGDDIYKKKDLEKAVQHDFSVLAYKMPKAGKGAKIIANGENLLSTIIENQDLQKGDYQNTGVYTLTKEIFKYPLVKIPNDEYGLPQTISGAINDFSIKVIETETWHRITTPDDLKNNPGAIL